MIGQKRLINYSTALEGLVDEWRLANNMVHVGWSMSAENSDGFYDGEEVDPLNDWDDLEITWQEGNPMSQPTKAELDAKKAAQEANEDARVAREIRDELLKNTDWIVAKATEEGTEIPADWKAYRQYLRNLPTLAEWRPTYNEERFVMNLHEIRVPPNGVPLI